MFEAPTGRRGYRTHGRRHILGFRWMYWLQYADAPTPCIRRQKEDTVNFCSHEPRHFPETPRNLWGSGVDCEDERRFFDQALEWCGAARQWLDSPAAYERLSTGFVRLLSWALGSRPAQPVSVSPYRIFPFPVDLRALSSCACVPCDLIRRRSLDIMLWRACIVDFLSDVWDTVGVPLFDQQECGYAADRLFMPPPVPGQAFCPDCLERFSVPDASGRFKAHYGLCPVRRALDDSIGVHFPGRERL
jgi:hypothetical protein